MASAFQLSVQVIQPDVGQHGREYTSNNRAKLPLEFSSNIEREALHVRYGEGFGGAPLIRPALERLRDAAAAGEVQRVYVYSPDRLARKYAYQVMLVDELQRAGVALVFLNRELGQSPECQLSP